MVDELAAVGRPFSNTKFNAIIYQNLGSDFHSIITALNQRPLLVTFQEIHGQLIAHEILIRNIQEPPDAHMVTRQF